MRNINYNCVCRYMSFDGFTEQSLKMQNMSITVGSHTGTVIFTEFVHYYSHFS